jgi:hypothetical protein
MHRARSHDDIPGARYNSRVTKITGHFDGRVVTPDDASRLKPNQSVTIEGVPADPDFGTLGYVWRHMMDPLPHEDAQQMLQDIEQACENVDPESDVRL